MVSGEWGDVSVLGRPGLLTEVQRVESVGAVGELSW